MTPQADIISSRFTKSVIKSCAAMSYVEAQARMDDRLFLISNIQGLLYLACSLVILICSGV